MITLNGEQGLVNVENWEDITSRPGFVTDLNPSDHKLDAIIGRYLFNDKVKCGLSNCHSPHARGYIVTTKEGVSTNIGKDCGKKYFGVDFEDLSKKFDRDFTAHENRIRLESFSFQFEELERTLTDLRQKEHGADWVYKKSRPLVTTRNGCPDEIVRRITSMVKSGSNILMMAREASQAEIDALEAAQGKKIQRPHVIEEPIAEIAGIQSLYPEYDIRSLLVLDLETHLEEFKALKIDTLGFEELRHWTKWVGTIENTVEKASTATSLGQALLTRANLEPFTKILVKNEDKSMFNSFLKGLS